MARAGDGRGNVTQRKPKRAKQLGITDADYASLLEQQDGHCALCPSTPKTRRLHVDHDHATGQVRGLLCHRCNRALPTWVTWPWLVKAAYFVAEDENVVRAAVTGASVRPLRIHVEDADLQTTRVRGIGFVATCECGEKSPRCAAWAMARGWLREHRRGCRWPEPFGPLPVEPDASDAMPCEDPPPAGETAA